MLSKSIKQIMPALCLGSAPPSIAAPTEAVVFQDLVRKQEVLLDPFPVAKVRFEDKDGADQTVPWSVLSGVVQRELLPNESVFVETRRFDSSGSFSLIPVNVTAKKGAYELVFRWMKYRNEYCVPANPLAGHVRIGVGLNIVLSTTTTKAGVNVSGLGPVAAAAYEGTVSGAISVNTIGLGTSSKVLSGFLTNSSITEETVDTADKAVAVVRAVIESSDTKLVPHRLAVVERTPGACTGEAPITPPAVTNSQDR